jgi:hypothetical protein
VSACSRPSLELVSIGSLAGDAVDALVLTPQVLEDGTPHNRIGGIGSGIAYTGVGTRYVAVSDRGPSGHTSYRDRYYQLDLSAKPRKFAIELLSSVMLTDERQQSFVGASSQYPSAARDGEAVELRFDAEAVRVSARGTLFVADEYGPYIYEFAASGQRLRTVMVPAHFHVRSRAASGHEELPPFNHEGRQPKLGMEGLAISPDGTKLYGLMQSPLLQDHALDHDGQPKGLYTRLLEIDLATQHTREFVYTLESKHHGTNEIVAINGHQFLVIERDWAGDTFKAFKKIFKIDIAGATDVSVIESLPAKQLPKGVTPVAKEMFIDMRARAFDIADPACPTKIEGLAFGPDLADGRHLLLVSCDNDFQPTVATKIVAIAIQASRLPDYQPQILRPEILVAHDGSRDAAEASIEFAVMSRDLFDATFVSAASARVTTSAGAADGAGSLTCSELDVDGDRRLDLSCRLSLAPPHTRASLQRAVFSAAMTSGHPVLSQFSVPNAP